METLILPNGDKVPKLGLGTWGMGERRGDLSIEVKAIRHALDVGISLLDTAEMYGDGGAEEIIGLALKGIAQKPYIVSKVYPHNASSNGVLAACDRSLNRLGVERIDLYLLHWRGAIELQETIELRRRNPRLDRRGGRVRRRPKPPWREAANGSRRHPSSCTAYTACPGPPLSPHP